MISWLLMAHNNNYKWARKSWRKQRRAGRALVSLRKNSIPKTCTFTNRSKRMMTTPLTMTLPRTIKKNQSLYQKKRTRPPPPRFNLKNWLFAICSFEREGAQRWTTSSTAKRKRRRTPFGHSRVNSTSVTSMMEITMNKTMLRAVLAATNLTAISTRLSQSTKENRSQSSNSARSTNSTRRRRGGGRI